MVEKIPFIIPFPAAWFWLWSLELETNLREKFEDSQSQKRPLLELSLLLALSHCRHYKNTSGMVSIDFSHT